MKPTFQSERGLLQQARRHVAVFGLGLFLGLGTVGWAQAQGMDPIELEFWRSAEKIGTEPAYTAYLQRFPSGAFAPLAKAALEKLGSNPSAASGDAAAPAYTAPTDSGAIGFPVGTRLKGPGVLTVGNFGARKQLLLPNGEWMVLAAIDYHSNHTSRVNMASVALAQLDGKVARSVLVATFNRRPADARNTWADAKNCEANTQNKLWHERQNKFPIISCMYVEQARAGGRFDVGRSYVDLWQAAQEHLKRLDIQIDAAQFNAREYLVATDHRAAYLKIERFDAQARTAWAQRYFPLAADGLRNSIEVDESTTNGMLAKILVNLPD